MSTTITVGTGSGGIGTSTIAFTVTVAGSPLGPPLPILSNPNSPCSQDLVKLLTGDNVLPINPKTSILMIRKPVLVSPIATTSRNDVGNTGGEPFDDLLVRCYGASPPASICIHAAADIDNVQVVQI